MKKVSFSKILKEEARACELAAAQTASPYAEAFAALAISYNSLVKRLQDEATPYKETNAGKNP